MTKLPALGLLLLAVALTALVPSARVEALHIDATPAVASQRPGCQDSSAPTCTYPSPDRLIIPSLPQGDPERCGSETVSAAVNIYDVDDDLQLGIPVADCDVVFENFAAFPGFGGYPGDGGRAVFAGHVDYHPHYRAVFWNLRYIEMGAEVHYERWDGQVITYAVDGLEAITDPAYDWGGLFAATEEDTLLLITCDGAFDPMTHEYDGRLVVHATRVSN
jgi:LPXTG-site transpeptidase (sortase) family protein